MFNQIKLLKDDKKKVTFKYMTTWAGLTVYIGIFEIVEQVI